MLGLMERLEELTKALEAGGYNAAPDTLRQGSALQVENCSSYMINVTYGDKHIKLQKDLQVESMKSIYAQFVRRLSYGQFGGSAQIEGVLGTEETSDFIRMGVPMCFYSSLRKVTLAADMVATQSNEKPSDLEAKGAAMKIAGDIEFDLFNGKDNFSNAGVFDGNPLAIPSLPNMMGLQCQVRQSDLQANTQDLMFEAYGGGLSVVQNVGGVLNQAHIEDATVRSALNHGTADKLYLDPLTLSAYNKQTFGKERIIVAGNAPGATGGDLRRQWTSNGTATLESSRFLSGKTQPSRAKNGTPVITSATVADTGTGTTFAGTEKFYYKVTGENELGEGPATASTQFTMTGAGKYINVTITPNTSVVAKFFNVYRSSNNGAASTCKFIGRIVNSGAATTVFVDFNNKTPGFVTGSLIQDDTMGIKELAPYSRMQLAVSALYKPEAHFRFLCLAVTDPRKNVLLDNLIGSSGMPTFQACGAAT